jgi:hypothetical protein
MPRYLPIKRSSSSSSIDTTDAEIIDVGEPEKVTRSDDDHIAPSPTGQHPLVISPQSNQSNQFEAYSARLRSEVDYAR